MIAPNPESALNEEAGKLLLEDYDSYCKHAKLITSIHAAKNKIDFSTSCKKKSQSQGGKEGGAVAVAAESTDQTGVLTPSASKSNTSCSLSPQKRSIDVSGSTAGDNPNPVKKVSAAKKNLRRL